MPDFNQDAADERHDYIIGEVQRIRDGLNKDVIDYYFNEYPKTENEELDQRADMRKYLRIAVEDINRLLDNELY